MVKSYKGVERAKEKKTIAKPVVVEDYMSRNLITFKPDQTMDQVLDLLLLKKISGGPVIDDNNRLVGIISEGDCLKQVVKGKYHNIPEQFYGKAALPFACPADKLQLNYGYS